MTFKPALTVKKEYAEKPFDLFGFRGSNRQFTVVEDLKVNQNPRMGRKTGTSKDGKQYSFEVALLKVSDGIFEKDMQLSETDWQKINVVRPDNLLSLKGVTYAYQGQELVFVGIVTPDMNENFQKPQQSPKDAPGQTNSSQVDGLYLKLAQGITFCSTIGQKTTKDVVIQIARNIVQPGQDVEAFIYAAKMAGWLVERDGIYSGTA